MEEAARYACLLCACAVYEIFGSVELNLIYAAANRAGLSDLVGSDFFVGKLVVVTGIDIKIAVGILLNIHSFIVSREPRSVQGHRAVCRISKRRYGLSDNGIGFSRKIFPYLNRRRWCQANRIVNGWQIIATASYDYSFLWRCQSNYNHRKR